jgi:hypothetical protein
MVPNLHDMKVFVFLWLGISLFPSLSLAAELPIESVQHCVRIQNRTDYANFNFHLLGQDPDGVYTDILLPAASEPCVQNVFGTYRLAATRQYQEQRLDIDFSTTQRVTNNAWWLDPKTQVYALWSDLEFTLASDATTPTEALVHIDLIEKTDMDARVLEPGSIESAQTPVVVSDRKHLGVPGWWPVVLVGLGVVGVLGVYVIATKTVK